MFGKTEIEDLKTEIEDLKKTLKAKNIQIHALEGEKNTLTTALKKTIINTKKAVKDARQDAMNVRDKARRKAKKKNSASH